MADNWINELFTHFTSDISVVTDFLDKNEQKNFGIDTEKLVRCDNFIEFMDETYVIMLTRVNFSIDKPHLFVGRMMVKQDICRYTKLVCIVIFDASYEYVTFIRCPFRRISIRFLNQLNRPLQRRLLLKLYNNIYGLDLPEDFWI